MPSEGGGRGWLLQTQPSGDEELIRGPWHLFWARNSASMNLNLRGQLKRTLKARKVPRWRPLEGSHSSLLQSVHCAQFGCTCYEQNCMKQ